MRDVIIEILSPLVSTWEGNEGIDVSRIKGEETETKYRKHVVFEPPEAVNNGPQKLTAPNNTASNTNLI